MAEVIERDALGRPRNLDAEYFGAERLVERDLRERQAQVESLRVAAGQMDCAGQAGLKIAILGAPLSRRRSMDGGDELPSRERRIAAEIHVGRIERHDAPVGAKRSAARG